MLSLELLRGYGADVDEALGRCLNNEAFYFRLIKMAMADDSYDKLKEALEAGQWKEAFERAHALKGVTSNLALRPIQNPVSELTERLRPQEPCEYAELLDEILLQKEKLTEYL